MFFLILFGLFLIGLAIYLAIPYILLAVVFPIIPFVKAYQCWHTHKIASRILLVLGSIFMFIIVIGIIVELA